MLSDDSDDDLLLKDYLGRSTRSNARKRPADGALTNKKNPSKNNDDADSSDADDEEEEGASSSRARDKAQQRQRQKTDRMVQSVLEGMSAERERRNRIMELERRQKENESRNKEQMERAAQRESDEQAWGQHHQTGGRLSIQDKVSGITVLYRDFTVFEDKELLKRRVRAMEDNGYASFGGRPGLIQFVPVVDNNDEGASFGAFDSYEDAVVSLQQSLRTSGFPEAASMLEPSPKSNKMQMTERIGFVLEDQLFSATPLVNSNGEENTNVAQSMATWLHRAAMTGTGKRSYCPALEELSSVALRVLIRFDDESPGKWTPSIVEFHSIVNQYGPAQLSAPTSEITRSVNAYLNVVGLERALTYWSFPRIMNASEGEVADSMTMSTISKLSLVLLDDSLERLHPQALDSILALVMRLVDKSRAGSDHGLSVLAEVAEKIFQDLPEILGPPPKSTKYLDDEHASLATSQLLAGLLQHPKSQDWNVSGWDVAFVSKCIRQFQLECARKALSFLDVSTLPQSDRNNDQPSPASPDDSTVVRTPSSATPESAASVASSPKVSPQGLWTDRPDGVNEEAWQAFLAVIHAVGTVPKDKEKYVRCLAVLHSIFSLFSTALQWLETPKASHTETETLPVKVECHEDPAAPSPPPGAGSEFGSKSQAQAWLAVVERLSNELGNLGKFLGSFPRNEYFRHADLLLQVVSAYVEQTARPLCAKQAGVSFKPIQLKQQDIRKYFD